MGSISVGPCPQPTSHHREENTQAIFGSWGGLNYITMKIEHRSEGIGKIGSNPKSKKEQQKKELYKMLKALPKPSAKFHLTTSQKYWWQWFGVELVKSGNFAKLDQIHLQRAAIWLDAKNMAIEKLNKSTGIDGWIQTFNSGASNIKPEVSIIEKADKALDQISAHFGLSLKDREKMKAEPAGDPNQTSLFDQFNGMKNAK